MVGDHRWDEDRRRSHAGAAEDGGKDPQRGAGLGTGSVTDNPDNSSHPDVEQYFAENPDIFAVELTGENTTPRRPR